jgi:hypothetical protein
VSPSGSGWPTAAASRCCRCSTPPPQAWPWPRPSVGGATTGTRSCSSAHHAALGPEIDIQNRPDGYTQYATFHPTFLYESLWNLALCGVLLLIDRRHRLRPGRLFVVYVAGYTLARFFIERIRIDTANKILGLRVNEWVSALLFLGAAGYLAVDAWRHRGEPVPDAEPVASSEPGPDTEPAVDTEPPPDAEPVADTEPDGETAAADVHTSEPS